MAAYATQAAGLARAIKLNSTASRVFVSFVVLILIASLAFVAGEHRHRNTTVLRGVAYTGLNEATITVDGWHYGVGGDVTWFDSQGTHIGSWPSCLRGVGRHVLVTFGAVPVTAPDGSSWQQVVWVDCRK